MSEAAFSRRLIRDGVVASRVQLGPGVWPTVLAALVARFPRVSEAVWRDRMARGLVLDARDTSIDADAPYRIGEVIRYWREVSDEPRVEARENILHVDARLVVADKPHGLAVTPAGGAVADTLLARLVRTLDNPHLVPLHRIDRDTAGLVMFSAAPASRAAYHALFAARGGDPGITKVYEALAPPLPAQTFPLVRRSRIGQGEPFFRMCETGGEPNAETHIDVIARGADACHYALRPVTGRKHQLRVHMAALGAPILGDRLYPELRDAGGLATHGDAEALQLLARSLAFVDPLDGTPRRFESALRLA